MSGGVVTRSNLPNLLVEGIKDFYGTGYANMPPVWKKFTDVKTSNKDREVYQEFAGVGLHVIKPEGTVSAEDSIGQGPETSIKNIAYALRLRITHEAIQDNLYKRILDEAKSMGESAAQTKETVVTDRLNTGFSTAAADLLADGEALFSTAHPLFAGSGTNANTPTVGASLSEASLTTAINNIAGFRDPRNKKIFVKGETLIVPQKLDVTAQKLLETELTVGSDNNDINPFGRNRGRLPGGFITSQFLTSETAWFIRTNIPGYIYQTREEPRMMEDVTISSMVNEMVSFQRFGVDVSDFRSLYGDPGV